MLANIILYTRVLLGVLEIIFRIMYLYAHSASVTISYKWKSFYGHTVSCSCL